MEVISEKRNFMFTKREMNFDKAMLFTVYYMSLY